MGPNGPCEMQSKLDALNLMNWRTTAVEAGTLQPYHASTAKAYGTESVADVYHLLLGVIEQQVT